jgi:CheY-like chemotaxis protein
MVSDQLGTEDHDNPASILLVDDQEANLLVLESILKDLGQDLVRARSGHEALRLLFDRDFAVILLDVRMPDMDGFETAELIRKRQKSRNTPIIFITAADASSDEIARGYRVGAVDFISKPLVPEVLTAKVGIFLELYKGTQLLSELPARLLQSQDEERQRIARQLHDGTSPALVGVLSRLHMLKNYAERWDTKASTDLKDCIALAENVAREIRNLSEHLYSRALVLAGFVSAMRSHAEAFGKQSGVQVELDLPATLGHLPQNVELVLFRILQEVLQYIQLHSNRQLAVIRFFSTKQEHTLEISDNRVKIVADVPALPERRKTDLEMRLAGPGERIKQLGGALSISTRSGVSVRAVVPVQDSPPYQKGS